MNRIRKHMIITVIIISQVNVFSQITVFPNDSQDIVITDEGTINQSENSVFINPTDYLKVLNSNNSGPDNTNYNTWGPSSFMSSDGGLTWSGDPTGSGAQHSGDPATAIDLSGRYYLGYIAEDLGQGVAYSSDEGNSWTHIQVAVGPSVGEDGKLDKNHLWVDNCPESQFVGNLYSAWTNLIEGDPNYSKIELYRSTDQGLTWIAAQGGNSISTGTNSLWDQGVNLQTGPNGEVYAVWSIYDNIPASNNDESAIGFARSLDGGITFEPAVRIIDGIRGIRASASKNSVFGKREMRVNSFPVLAVDISHSENRDNLYVVWSNVGKPPGLPGPNNLGSEINVYMIKSVDIGGNWSVPVNISGNPHVPPATPPAVSWGKQAFFPWISCDPILGDLAIIYYDDKYQQDVVEFRGYLDVTVCIIKADQVVSQYERIQINDVSFEPEVTGVSLYFTDYIGIAVRDGMVYPFWTGNPSDPARKLTYTSPFSIYPKMLVTNQIETSPQNLGGELSLVNHERNTMDFPVIESALEKPVIVEESRLYSAETMEQDLGLNDEYKHFKWDTDQDHFLVKENFQINANHISNGLTAWFRQTQEVIVTSNVLTAPIQIYDPWYQDDETGIQPDDYHLLETLQYPVFPDIDPEFMVDHYILRAPNFIHDNSLIYRFLNFTSSTAVANIFPIEINEEGYTDQSIEFIQSGTITANYELVGAGEQILLSSSMNFIPAGTEISIPPGCEIIVQDYSKLWGTVPNPVVFKGLGGQEWNGILLGSMSGGEMFQNIIIENTTTAITASLGSSNIEINNVLIDDADIGFMNQPAMSGSVVITNSTFQNIEGNCIDIAMVNTGFSENWEISDNTFKLPSQSNNTAISFKPSGPTTTHPEFHNITIKNNQISSYNRGIDIELYGVIPYTTLGAHLNWNQDLLRIVVENNTIDNCFEHGIKVTGQHALYSHNNIVTNCGTGYYVYRVSDGVVPGNSEKSHRIHNETLTENGTALYFGELGSYGQSGWIENCIFWDNLAPNNVDIGAVKSWYNIDVNPLFLDPMQGDYRLGFLSLAIDTGNPDFDMDGNDWDDPDPADQDLDETQMDIGAIPTYKMGGTQTSDVTIQDAAWITSNYTVGSSAILTILPGTDVFVAEDAMITVTGTLNATGTAEAPILFGPAETTTDKRYWGGLRANLATVNLAHVQIENGIYGAYLYKSNGSIANLTLDNNYYGIIYYQSTMPSLQNSSVTNSQYYGLYVNGVSPDFDIINNSFSNNKYGLFLYNSAGLIRNNTITGNTDNGIRFYGQSSANMNTIRVPGETPYAVNNSISNTTSGEGIEILTGSFPILGSFTETPTKVYGGFNEIFANGGGVSALNNNTTKVDAELNWWSGSWNMTKFNWDPPVVLYTPGGIGKASNLDLDPLYTLLREADHFFVDSSYVEAIDIYDQVLRLVPDDSVSIRALVGLTACYNAEGDNDALLARLGQIESEFDGHLVAASAMDYSVAVYMRQNRLDEALIYNENVISFYESMIDVDEALASALFERSLIHEDIAFQNEGLGKSSATARSIATIAKQRVLKQYAHTDIANLIRVLNGEEEIDRAKRVMAPETYILHSPYPNPFNPSTTILYELPKTADVTIQIYDLLGRNIWSYKESVKPAGYYSLEWNGMNQNGKQVASGVYLISFSTPEFRAVQKAVLIR